MAKALRRSSWKILGISWALEDWKLGDIVSIGLLVEPGPLSMRTDARIEDVLHTLARPEDYVRGIVGSFITGRFNHDVAIIRIGISGAGVAPHYCIEQGLVAENLGGIEINKYERRAIFHGRTHSAILEEEFKGLSWSSAALRFPEVQAILGRLRASKKID